MVVKKFLSAVAACVLACAAFAGCGDNPQHSPEDAKIGMIADLNLSEQQFNNLLRKNAPGVVDYYFVPFDNLNSMQMALSAGNIDEMSTYKSVADYLIARRREFAISDAHTVGFKMVDKFCCAVKSGNEELRDLIAAAIQTMQSEGTLDLLKKQYIDDLNGNEEPPAIEMPHFEGVETLKVGVTGDLPPLDLIKADGTPAGFNTAVLAEISKHINKNFELVSVETAARASALSSGNIDVVFWVRVPATDELLPGNADCPDGVIITEPYFSDEIVHVGKRQ